MTDHVHNLVDVRARSVGVELRTLFRQLPAGARWQHSTLLVLTTTAPCSLLIKFSVYTLLIINLFSLCDFRVDDGSGILA